MAMTRQQMFNKTYRGLAKQGFVRSKVENERTCLYRGPEGRRCAVGWLIPDRLFTPGMNADSVYGIADVLEKLGVSPDDLGFLEDLQYVHDNLSTPEDMQAGLSRFAAAHGLTIPEVK